MTAIILSPRTGDGATAETAHRAQILVDYPVGARDISNQPGLAPYEQYDPPLMMVNVWRHDSATLDEIDANPDYHVLHSDNRPAGAIPDAAEFGLLRAYLARQKVSQATIREWIGTGSQGRTRAEIAAILREHLHDLPKAE